jgi:5'-3' exonuclease
VGSGAAVRILICDLSSIFFPAWHAGADKPIAFSYDVSVSRVRKAAEGFDRVVVACDSGRCFRHDIDPSYKAGRAERDPAMLEQLRRVQETLEADAYHVVSVEGFEADDIIATFVRWAREQAEPHEIEILSGDKDLCQLVGQHVRVRTVSKGELLGPAEVLAKFEVTPDQVRDWLTLAGDPSDGIKGVRGVGPKNAAKLLRDFGTVGAIKAALKSGTVVGTPSITTALLAAVEDGTVDRCAKLVALRGDVPIDCALLLEERQQKPLRQDFGADMPPDDADDEPQTETRSMPQQDGTMVQEQTQVDTATKPPASAEQILDMAKAPVVEWSRALEPRGPQQLVIISRHLFESRLFFPAHKNAESIEAVILAGRELGIGAMAALRNLSLIKGKIAMGSDFMAGLALARGLAEYFEPVRHSPEEALYETKRVGRPPKQMRFNIEQAKTMKLYPGKRGDSGEPTQWEKDPEIMLIHRCKARLARLVYPDLLTGCYLPEELAEE